LNDPYKYVTKQITPIEYQIKKLEDAGELDVEFLNEMKEYYQLNDKVTILLFNKKTKKYETITVPKFELKEVKKKYLNHPIYEVK